MEELILSRSFGTHDGAFHADEVTACALLIFFGLVDRDKIRRTRNLNELTHLEFVCDVGGLFDPLQKRFDHHQADYNGKQSSAGMVLDYLFSQFKIAETQYVFLQNTFVKGVDEVDNGLIEPIIGHASFSSIISSFVPIHHDATKEEYDLNFEYALDFVLAFLKRICAKLEYIQQSKEIVLQAMEDHPYCLMFDSPIPWIETFFENGGIQHSAQFVMMPSQGHWKLRAIPPSLRKKAVRTPLPKEWAGLLDEELKIKSQISGAIFCHKGRFISVWKTKEDALKALEYIKKKKHENNL